MWQKSAIQQINERQNILYKFKVSLNSLLEKYNIQDNIFGIAVDGQLYDITEGYFVGAPTEYASLDEAIQNMDSGSCIRIVENNKFVLGKVYSSFNDCHEGSVLLIKESQEITK
jgi:hypothetical protein